MLFWNERTNTRHGDRTRRIGKRAPNILKIKRPTRYRDRRVAEVDGAGVIPNATAGPERESERTIAKVDVPRIRSRRVQSKTRDASREDAIHHRRGVVICNVRTGRHRAEGPISRDVAVSRASG